MLCPLFFSLEILNLSAEHQHGIQSQPARLKQSIESGIVHIASDQDQRCPPGEMVHLPTELLEDGLFICHLDPRQNLQQPH